MSRFLVDGRFLNSMSTGVDRYACQILKELDPLCKGMDISILIPPDAKEIPSYQNIRIIRTRKSRHWTQLVFGPCALRMGAIPVNLCNEMPYIGKKGIVCLHDVCYAETEEVFPFVYDIPKEEREWFQKVYKRIAARARKIITVSEFSKNRIMERLQVPAEQITVIGNGWQHFQDVPVDDQFFQQNPALQDHSYYFTLTSANRNKNLDWVLEASRVNPEATFVVAGKDLNRQVDFSKYPNIFYAGYASDSQAKTWMTHCKAFLFPSFYEGFGIPPMEAMSTGVPVVISRAASLPEIFGGAAHYIDPSDPCVDLEQLLAEPVEPAETVLSAYSWKDSAEKLLHVLLMSNE